MASYEVYKSTQDKQDFIENIVMIANYQYKGTFNQLVLVQIKNDILEVNQEDIWDDDEIQLIFQGIDQEVKLILASYELYNVSKEEFERTDLIDSIKLYLKQQSKK